MTRRIPGGLDTTAYTDWLAGDGRDEAEEVGP